MAGYRTRAHDICNSTMSGRFLGENAIGSLINNRLEISAVAAPTAPPNKSLINGTESRYRGGELRTFLHPTVRPARFGAG